MKNKVIVTLLIILSLFSLISCRSTHNNVSKEESNQWNRPGVSAVTLTDEQWLALFPEPETQEKPETIEELPPVEVIEEPPREPEVIPEVFEEEITEETSESEIIEEDTTEPVIVHFSSDEISFEEETEEIISSDLPVMLAGEEKANWEWITNEEETEGLETVSPLPVEQIIDPESGFVEDVNPEIVSAIADDYNTLYQGLGEKPGFKEYVLKFVIDNLLYIYAGVIVLIIIITITAVIKNKKKQNEKEEIEEDKGEEIITVMDGLTTRNEIEYYRSPEDNSEFKEESEEITPVPESKPEEQSEDDYDDGF